MTKLSIKSSLRRQVFHSVVTHAPRLTDNKRFREKKFEAYAYYNR